MPNSFQKAARKRHLFSQVQMQLYIDTLPPPTAPGEETERNRREIGEMLRRQSMDKVLLIPTHRIILPKPYDYGDYIGLTQVDEGDWIAMDRPEKFYYSVNARNQDSPRRNYPMVMWQGDLRAVHRVVGFIHTGNWSEEHKWAWHHKNDDAFNATWENLEEVSWDHNGTLDTPRW